MAANKYKTLKIRKDYLDTLLSEIKSDITSADGITFNHGKLSALLSLDLISYDVYSQVIDSAMNSVFGVGYTLKLTTGEAP